MTRPKYETAAHQEIEAAFFKWLCDKNGLTFEKWPDEYILDGLLSDDTPYAFAEYKRRYCSSTIPIYFISLNKVIAAREYTAATGLPSFLFVEFNDCTTALNLATDWKCVKMNGRTDRGDPADLELCAHYPTIWLKRLKR